MTSTEMTIASVSLEQPLESIATELGHSFEELGFGVVRDHGIPDALVDQAWDRARAFFDLPDDLKRAYAIAGSGGARGYTPFGTEKAKDAAVHDLKEFWHVGQTLEPGDPLNATMPPNVWPAEVQQFEETFQQLYRTLESVGTRILSAIALHMGLDRNWFTPTVERGNSVLRLLHYPPVRPGNEGAVRAAAHEDINTITLLLGAEEAGLELQRKDGSWMPIDPPEGALVVNIGDMLQRLTAGRLRSTTHRVVNPVGEAARRSRYSMPFFLHFRSDFMIDPDKVGIARSDDPAYAPISADDYLMQRLREINLV
ncbi:isopenicillin N synthase family dioxygenase [Altererythrobacter sp. CAU 1778]